MLSIQGLAGVVFTEKEKAITVQLENQFETVSTFERQGSRSFLQI